MFDLTDDTDVHWQVKLPRVNTEGDVEEIPVLIRYRIFTRAELKAKRANTAKGLADQLAAEVQKPDNSDGRDAVLAQLAAIEDTNEAELLERVTGWKGITKGGVDLPFSEKALKALMKHEGRYQALRAGLTEASRGARAKN